MPWQGSTRRAQLPPDWQARRMRVLRRDGYRCQHKDDDGLRCLRPANQCDHVVPGGDHAESNLQALCDWHHRRKSAAEGAAARALAAAGRRTRERPPERHPGAYSD